MAGWCISGRGRRWIHVLLLVLVLAFGCSHATAHRRSLQQTTEQTGDLAVNEDAKLKADKTDKPDKPDKPDKIKTASKRRGGFKKDNDAKQYLDDLGPDTVQQILLNAGNLNQPTLEEGRAALEQLMSSSNDMIVDADLLGIQAQCPPAPPPTAEMLASERTSVTGPARINGSGSGLSSRPSSPKKLWLDFVCGDVTNTDWNIASNLSVISMTAFDKDQNGPAFTNDELIYIEDIWKSVAEDFSPFDVDITTNPVPVGSNPATYARIMICDGRGDWYATTLNGGVTAGGVSYVGSWGRSDTRRPAFVFATAQSNYVKYIWESISHELGHVMGLSHDGNSTSEYWAGNQRYGPIMGNQRFAYSISQWSKGDYFAANNKEDDIDIIASKLGWVPTGQTRSSSTNCAANPVPLPAIVSGPNNNPNVGQISSFILQAYMSDVYSFNAGNGTATVSCDVAPNWVRDMYRANLDCQLTVISPTGQMLATINPGLGFDAANNVVGLGTGAVQVVLPVRGMYYVYVQGMGNGDPMAGGASAYGSIGSYTLTVQYPPPPVAPPSPSPPAPAASPCNAVISSGPTKTTVTGGYGCSVTVTVKSGATSGSGTLLAGAAVDVLWFHSYTTAIAGWDNTAGVLRTGTTLSGKTAGTVTISSPTMPKGKGGCRARVQSVRLTGYSLSAAVEKPTTWNS